MFSPGNYRPNLLFGFFVDGVLPAPPAVLLQLDFALHQLLIFATPIIDSAAGLAGKFD